jgi:LEA14-like dessication related protein
MKAKQILIPLLLAIGGYAAFAVVRQMQLIKQSCVKFLSYRFEHIGLKYVSLIVQLQLKNNSDINLKILSGNFDSYINDVFVTNIKTAQANLPAHATSVINLKIEFDPGKVLKMAIASLLNSPENIKVRIKGYVTAVSSAIILSNIKIDESITLAEILSPSTSTDC